MKNRKFIVLILVVLAVVVLAACGGKYSDAIEIMEKQTDAMEAYCDRLDKADNAEEVASAMNKFGADMKKLAPKMAEFHEKYPDLYKDGTKMPDEFAQIQKRSEEVTTRMTATLMKMVRYLMDPKVQQAMMNMNAAMMKMGE